MSGAAVSLTPETILGHISDALALVDLDGRLVYVNERLADLLGSSVNAVRGQRWQDVLDAENAARLDPANWAAPDCPEKDFTIEMPVAGGRLQTFCLTASTVRDAHGRTIGILESFRGIDRLPVRILEFRNVNDAIRREKDKTEQVLDSISDGVITIDRALVVRTLSPRLERLLGIREADAVGRPCSQVMRGSRCASDCPMHWTLERGAVVERCREVLRRPDGSTLPVSLTTAFVHDVRGEVEGLLGVVRDQSEIEHLRRQVKERVLTEERLEAWLPMAPNESPARAELRRVLEAHRWNASRAARSLGISRTTLWRRMRQYHLMETT